MKRTLIFALCLILLIYLVVSIVNNYRSGSVISPIPNSHESLTGKLLRIFRPGKNPDKLKKIITDSIGKNWQNYSVLVVDLNSDFKTGFNENVMYTAASVNKVAILAALYDLYRKGAVDPAQILTLQKDDIQDYGTGSIRYDPPGTTYSVKTLSMLMMRKSDNTAAYLLANYVITVPLIQEMLGQWGLTQTDMVNNLTTSADMAILFQKIYQGQIAGDSYTKEMLNLMQESDFEDRLPARLPKGTAVYHKIGSETGFIHDVGIVNSGKNQWYIGVFTRDITDEPAAKDKIAEISKKVYDYMN